MYVVYSLAASKRIRSLVTALKKPASSSSGRLFNGEYSDSKRKSQIDRDVGTGGSVSD